jgi:hypothetical protein
VANLFPLIVSPEGIFQPIHIEERNSMWGALMLGAGVFFTLLVGVGTAWTIVKVEMSQDFRRLLTKWAVYCCLMCSLLLLVPGVLAIAGVIPSTPVVAACGLGPNTFGFLVLFLWLGNEWRKLLIEPPANMEWLTPWEPVGESGDGLVRELKKELGSGHVLHGSAVAAVGRRIDCDDVLFATPDASKPLAVVHLTWSGHAETDPTWPTTAVYKDWQDWISRCLVPDHQAYSGD